MHVQKTDNSTTEVTLTITAGESSLAPIKQVVVQKLAPKVKLQGFREGKAPLGLIEKNIDPKVLQTEFLDEALTVLYMKATEQEKVRPVTRPQVNIKKFVPFTDLEFTVTTGVIGKIGLPNYKKISVSKEAVKVTDKDVQEVINSLKIRLADKTDVERASKSGDQVWIDFKGTDEKGKPIQGADGKEYPLLLGSDTFIPGFEANIVGMKAGDKKTFTLTFPKSYGVRALANKKVTFEVSVSKVQIIEEPKEDDEFAKKAGPFTTLAQLRDDIKTQLKIEREREATTKQQDEIVRTLVSKSSVDIPGELIEQQVEYSFNDLKQNLAQRGQTLKEFLDLEAKSESQYRDEVVRPQAENQLKTSLVLAEIADVEQLVVTPEELEVRLQLLKGQYQDPKMQAELDKEENRRDIASRMLSEKVLALITQ